MPAGLFKLLLVGSQGERTWLSHREVRVGRTLRSRRLFGTSDSPCSTNALGCGPYCSPLGRRVRPFGYSTSRAHRSGSLRARMCHTCVCVFVPLISVCATYTIDCGPLSRSQVSTPSEIVRLVPHFGCPSSPTTVLVLSRRPIPSIAPDPPCALSSANRAIVVCSAGPNPMPPSSKPVGPLLELRTIDIGHLKVRHRVWSFNIRALPGTNATLKETLDQIRLDKAYPDKTLPDHAEQYRRLLDRLEGQLAVLNEWHGSPAWRQLDEGGATWSDMPHLPGEDCGHMWARAKHSVDETIQDFERKALEYVHCVPTKQVLVTPF
jgi:hypothetical protein